MKNILIIEDDDIMRDMLLQIMSKEGLYVKGVENGNKALKYLNKKKFDLVITDIIMPEKEGIEIINILRKTQPNIPVIAISGGATFNSEIYLDMVKELGVKFALKKPFNKNELLTTVKKCLNKK